MAEDLLDVVDRIIEHIKHLGSWYYKERYEFWKNHFNSLDKEQLVHILAEMFAIWDTQLRLFKGVDLQSVAKKASHFSAGRMSNEIRH